jgi:hypothetical protein
MRAITIPFPTVSGLLVGGGGCITWHSSLETTGSAAATYRLWDGASAANKNIPLLPISLSAGQSTRDFIAPHILPFQQGVYFELVSGSVQGSLAVMVGHDCNEHLALIVESLTVNL